MKTENGNVSKRDTQLCRVSQSDTSPVPHRVLHLRSGPHGCILSDTAPLMIGVAAERLRNRAIQKNRRKITMGTKKLCKVLLIAFFAITLSTISFAQENRILMTSEQQYQNMVPNSS